MDSLDGWSVVSFLAAISCSDPVVNHYLIPWTLTNVHFTGQSAFCSYKEELWNNSRFILAIGKLTVTNLVTHWSADSVILAIHLKGTLSKDASWRESVQTFYFPGHLVLSTFMHLSCLAQSHISMMCTSEEQKKVFLWCNWLFCHTCQPCLWHTDFWNLNMNTCWAECLILRWALRALQRQL